MTTRVERGGIESCMSTIRNGIESLETAAKTIDSAMGQLPNSWEGAAYDKAASTYEEQYKTLLTVTLPEAVEEFRAYINNCMETIIEIDNELAGQG